MLNLRFEVLGQVQLSRYFTHVTDRMADLRVPFQAIANDFYRSQSATFEAEGSFESKKKWASLSPAYRAWKEKKFPGRNILVLSGQLKKAATSSNAKGSVFNLQKTSLEMGVDLPVGDWNLAALHQLGTGKMPAREVIRLSSRQKNRWVRIVRDWHYRLFENARSYLTGIGR